MLYVRCKVTCDECQAREEVFDTPGGPGPTLPASWEFDREDEDEVVHGGPDDKTICPSCVKKRA